MARDSIHARACRPAAGRTSLTAAGWGAVVSGVALVAGGWTAGYREPVAVGISALLAVVFAVLWTWPGPGVTANRRLDPGHSERGGQVTATVRVRRTAGRARAGFRLTDRCGTERRDVALVLPPQGHTGTLRYPVPTPRRGRVPVGPLRIVASDPFGLCRRVHPCGGEDFLLVRPKTVPLGLPASGREPRLDGVTSGAVHGATAAFHALRAYVPGDDRRMVHWKSSARTGSLMVRQMADVSLPRTTVLLDTDPAHYRARVGRETDSGGSPSSPCSGTLDVFETAVDVCASIAAAASAGRFPVRIVTDAGALAPGGDSATPDALLDALALVQPGAPGAFDRAVHALGRAPHGGSLVAVVGALPAAALSTAFRTFAGFSHVAVIRVGAAGQAAPPGLRIVDIAGTADLRAGWHRVSGR